MAQSRCTVCDGVDDVPVLLQAALEHGAQRGIVLGNEDPHRLRDNRAL